jgi:hypothetical protein
MASKFAQFLTDNGIDPRRVTVASRAIERLRPEDRRIRLEQRRTKSDEGGGGGDKGKTPPAKPRSGRIVTARLLREAMEGKRISGPAKHRLVRAVNRILEQKKKDPVDLRALF